MISSKKLMKMARKWRNLAIVGRKRINFSRTTRVDDARDCSTSSVVKGHVVVYSADERRFTIPLAYLNSELLKELLRMAEEEYGLPSEGPIILPCDAASMEYAISLIKRHATKDLEKALLTTISTSRCWSSSCFHHEQSKQQLTVCSF